MANRIRARPVAAKGVKIGKKAKDAKDGKDGKMPTNVVRTGRRQDDPPLDMDVLHAQRAHMLDKAAVAGTDGERQFWASQARKMDLAIAAETEKQKRTTEDIKRQVDDFLGPREVGPEVSADFDDGTFPWRKLMMALFLVIAALVAMLVRYFLA